MRDLRFLVTSYHAKFPFGKGIAMNATHPVQSLLSMVVGQGSQLEGTPLTVFPLMWNQQPSVETVLAASAVTSGAMEVTELPGYATVPKLSVRNKSGLPVLIPQGTVLSGGRQDRVVNETEFVPAGRDAEISVSCVQHGRWSGGHTFNVAESMVSIATRHAAGSTVFGESYAQQTVWETVSQLHTSLGVSSQSQQFTSVFDKRGADVERFVRKLPYVAGAYGVAVALGRKVVLIDIFGDAASCEQMWPKIVRGSATDALGSCYKEGTPRRRDVAFKIRMMTDFEWPALQRRGEAVTWRRTFGTNQGVLVTYDNDILHLSCVRQSAI